MSASRPRCRRSPSSSWSSSWSCGDEATSRCSGCELPGPEISKAASTEDARVTVEFQRAEFNRLAEEGTARDYREAYDAGHIRVSGDSGIQKLIAQVIDRHEQRARTKKVH